LSCRFINFCINDALSDSKLGLLGCDCCQLVGFSPREAKLASDEVTSAASTTAPTVAEDITDDVTEIPPVLCVFLPTSRAKPRKKKAKKVELDA
jgi:hypothetical protein